MNNSIYATKAYFPFGSRLTYAKWGVSLYAVYSHMRIAAVVICLWSRYGGRKPFYTVEWVNDRLCREMADMVILEGQRAGGSRLRSLPWEPWQSEGGQMLFSPFCTRFVPEHIADYPKPLIFLAFSVCHCTFRPLLEPTFYHFPLCSIQCRNRGFPDYGKFIFVYLNPLSVPKFVPKSALKKSRCLAVLSKLPTLSKA